MYPDLYLMRHGQTEWNAAGKIQGRLDSPLTPKGITQAKRLAELVAKVQANRFSSPQGRAMQTAKIVFGDNEFVTDDRLCEIDVGDFSGEMIENLRLRKPEFFAGSRFDWYDRTPNGEHFAELSARTKIFLDSLTGPALVVMHGVALRMLRIHALDWPLSRFGELTIEQGAVHVIKKSQHEVWR